MQKVINVVALLSGLVSLSVVGGGAYLYMNKDTLVEDAREKVAAAVTEAITGELPGLLDGLMPNVTGSPIPLGEAGPVAPRFP